MRTKGGGEYKYFLLVIAVLLVDQLAKLLVLKLRPSVALINNILYISASQNTGAAFSLFTGYGSLLLWLGLIIVGILIFYFDKMPTGSKWYFALMIGGAIGNIIDRIFRGSVVDFIAPSFWPSFNIADSCITIGAILLIIFFIKEDIQKKK